MQLRDYLRVLRRSWLLIFVLIIAGAGAGAAYSVTQDPSYDSTAKVFVSSQSGGTLPELTQAVGYTQQVVSSYVAVATTPLVLDPVVDELNLGATAEDLASHLAVSNVTGTVIIDITATDNTAEGAAAIANAVSESLTSAVTDLTVSTDGGASPLLLTVVQQGPVPTTPSSPNLPLNIVIAALIGLAFGVIAAALREALDQRVRGAVDLAALTDRPLLGSISRDPEARKRPLVTHADPRSPRAEAFRTLRTNLQFLDISRGTRTIVVTSAIEAEGKSTTAANLAITVAGTGGTTLVIDADLRRPRLANYLGIDGTVGLTDVLIGDVTIDEALQHWGDNKMMVLPAGTVPPNPSELLQGTAMVALLATLKKRFGTIIIDAPPLLPVSDAAILGMRASGLLIVSAARRVKRDEVTRALAIADQVGARVLGMVLTMLPSRGPDAQKYGSYGYGALTEGKRRRADETSEAKTTGESVSPLS